MPTKQDAPKAQPHQLPKLLKPPTQAKHQVPVSKYSNIPPPSPSIPIASSSRMEDKFEGVNNDGMEDEPANSNAAARLVDQPDMANPDSPMDERPDGYGENFYSKSEHLYLHMRVLL